MSYGVKSRKNEELRRVQIREVNSPQRTIYARDAQGTNYQIPLGLVEDVVSIPRQGETWVIRKSSLDWMLERRIDDDNPRTGLTDMQPGDRRLEAPGTLFLNGEKIVLNFGDASLYVEDEHLIYQTPEGATFVLDKIVEDTSSLMNNVYIQDDPPAATGDYLWLQTGLGTDGSGFTMWFEDDVPEDD